MMLKRFAMHFEGWLVGIAAILRTSKNILSAGARPRCSAGIAALDAALMSDAVLRIVE